ncbi:hypothetical protein [Actinoallomurus soli]|uniref:hypothetical protein n=1 Tax=Actinoallomurus soli TaxID=2952535 RepID=UPI002093AE01|nr:hypothetical protein [Actinoallomurus soli]MCO5972298.1 hypothetical protein [Actinoallomurus soli]
MGGLQSGGGTSAVAASAHAGCERFRLTDPFITRRTRKVLAARIGHPDVGAGIPEARWTRAMTFETLVRSERFVSELLTKTVGRLDLARPEAVRRRDCRGTVAGTAAELAAAHRDAESSGQATMLTALAVPYLDLENIPDATPVQPDFAIVCPREEDGRAVGSWLIMGDAKDYERIRSRIDDGRMLKGFLQVALGAESAAAWSGLPAGMRVHRCGALAVPRNAFLQPEAVVESLDDHRIEVRTRADERLKARAELGDDPPAQDGLGPYVAGLTANFDPRGCATCNLFFYCRAELRGSGDPLAVLTEIGIDRLRRPAVAGLVSGDGADGAAPRSVVDQVRATVTGLPSWTGRLRTDPCGLPGTIDLVLVKSDASALGVHGVAVRRMRADGPTAWTRRVFADPQSPFTRRAVMRILGAAIRESREAGTGPVHLVVPDQPTADLLATAADSLAGVELSRLRWQHDLDSGRPALTFDGEPATLPEPLHDDERLAVAFLLEQDRARAMSLRTPIVDLRAVLAAHVTPGGPAVDAGRLDYLLTWAEATGPLDHREISDAIAERPETPGARLSNVASDAIDRARRAEDTAAYEALVGAALDYRVEVLERAHRVLGGLGISRLREAHRVLEADAQEIWGRRVALQASDLVRFSRMHPRWRNSHVDLLDADRTCFEQLTCLADTAAARDRAADAGVRELALATVIGLDPIRLDVRSRRLGDGSEVVALHVGDHAVVERPETVFKIQKGSFKLGRMPVGTLRHIDDAGGLGWDPLVVPDLTVGDTLVLADTAWFTRFKSGHEIAVKRPSLDDRSAPKPTCTPDAYTEDPEEHQYCCRPHTAAEAEWADTLAERRSRGELNPQVWPPLVDEERFDVGPHDERPPLAATDVPGHLTLDDLD